VLRFPHNYYPLIAQYGGFTRQLKLHINVWIFISEATLDRGWRIRMLIQPTWDLALQTCLPVVIHSIGQTNSHFNYYAHLFRKSTAVFTNRLVPADIYLYIGSTDRLRRHDTLPTEMESKLKAKTLWLTDTNEPCIIAAHNP